MYLLGVHLADHKLVRIALTNFYGISYDTASRLCARLSLHDRATVSNLTESQITQLSAYLSSPASIPARKPQDTSSSNTLLNPTQNQNQNQNPNLTHSSSKNVSRPSMESNPINDTLRQIKIEADLKRILHANINHHRNVGSYRGRRHASHLPVRGQRTSTNARTSKKLNRLERRAFVTYAQLKNNQQNALSLNDLLAPLVKIRFAEH
ncbi:related to mitochondrial ribosomal protein S13 [Melanopsichium pennsylvanicum]|uniref:Related to mitochondrial ribosomal protein S13 n=1 Tax=Melanopsichium pennsylvanicum TaxID=63383 RepID=A0AAJ5C3L6_9BASI|nr:related to mitochondrial ribosomal protein S13 [Melanopsichium pennsylvanicum]